MDPAEIIEAARTAVKADLLDEAVVLLDALGDLPSARLWLLRADLHRERCEPELALRALKRACELGAGDEARDDWLCKDCSAACGGRHDSGLAQVASATA